MPDQGGVQTQAPAMQAPRSQQLWTQQEAGYAGWRTVCVRVVISHERRDAASGAHVGPARGASSGRPGADAPLSARVSVGRPSTMPPDTQEASPLLEESRNVQSPSLHRTVSGRVPESKGRRRSTW
jgi:hypothetical protein